jgi:hypothetical protein
MFVGEFFRLKLESYEPAGMLDERVKARGAIFDRYVKALVGYRRHSLYARTGRNDV